MCARNLHARFPDARIIVTDILPAHAPGQRFYEDIRETNRALLPLGAQNLDISPKVQRLNLWPHFTKDDGSIQKDLFTADQIHLSEAGYAVYAGKLKPILAAALSGMAKPTPD
jgi:lysophospholipase L1-like esterase